MPIEFAVKIVRLKLYIIVSKSEDLALHSRSQLRLKLDNILNLYYNSHISDRILSYGIQTWHDGRPMGAIYDHARVDDLELDARLHWVGKGKQNQR